jgi:hypothetical protein
MFMRPFKYRFVKNIKPIACTQSVPGGKINIVGGHSIRHSKKKKYIHVDCITCTVSTGNRNSMQDLFPIQSFGTVQWSSSFTKTFRNRTRLCAHFFLLRMTDTETSQIIDLPFWDTCIICLKYKFCRLHPDWIDMAQDRDQWRALVNTVLNLQVP